MTEFAYRATLEKMAEQKVFELTATDYDDAMRQVAESGWTLVSIKPDLKFIKGEKK